MSDDDAIDQLAEAQEAAKLALLKQIAKQAEGTGNASTVERLAYAYALTVGGSPGKLPGGPFQVNVSK